MFRKGLLLGSLLLMGGCVGLDTGPDPALIGSCKMSVEQASKSLKEAELKGYTTTSAYQQSYKLVTQAKVHLNFKKYAYCLRKSERAQQYLGKLLSTGQDI